MIAWIEQILLRYFDKRYKLSSPQPYKDVLETISRQTFGITKEERYRYYGYLMKVFKLNLKAECFSIILKEEYPSVRELDIIIPWEGYDENHVLKKIIELEDRKVSLNDENLICIPWNSERMIKSVNDITNRGFDNKCDRLNGAAVYYTEIELCYRYNGIHHVAAAAMIGSGEITTKTYDITPLFDIMSINDNGEFVSVGEPCKAYGTDYRVAILYHLARERWRIRNGVEANLK